MRYIVVLITLLIFNSCGFKELKPLKYYTIKAPTNIPIVRAYPNSSVKVSYPLSLSRSLDYKMAFDYGNGKRGFYQNSQWIRPLGKLVHSNIYTTLKKAQAFRDVLPLESSVLENYRVEITVNEFKNLIESSTSYAVVDLDISLVDMNSRSIIKRKHFSLKEPSTTLNAKGYANAVNRAFEKIDNKLLEWLKSYYSPNKKY
jgi:ABC-type uncharacterized transport system auxiliary subunit